MKKIFAVILTLTLLVSTTVAMPVDAYAAENISDTSIAEKTSKSIDEKGRFEVEIQVPGDDGKECHDEVIVMVDGSYSTDDDWSTTRNAILEIGKTVLEGNGNTLLTVMTFGMGDNVVLEHIASVSELDATLTELPGGLLYGRSSTNCEAGFTGIAEYIESHDDSLNEVHVVYITDGEINTDETKHVFFNWTENTWLKKDALTIAQWALSAEMEAYAEGETVLSNAYVTLFGDQTSTSVETLNEEAVSEGEEALAEDVALEEEETTTEEVEPEEEETTTEEVEPEEEETMTEEVEPEEEETSTEEVDPEEEETTTEDVAPEEEETTTEDVAPEEEETSTEDATLEEVVSEEKEATVKVLSFEKVSAAAVVSNDESSEEDISDEKVMAWAAQIWKDVYKYSGMDSEKAYTVSDTERAFVKYDKENGTHIQEMWYYSLWGRTYPDRYTRTPEAGLELAANEKVAQLYMVDSNKATSWMSNMVNSANNVSFYEAGSVSNLLTALEGVLTNLSYTPYNDVVVTDYMSKWVNLDTTTIEIVDNNSETIIWTSANGWLISENRPTAQEIPVIVEEVFLSEYAEGGANVVGNENGTIYKLTWYVKDGAMLRSHNYSLVYEVDVDSKEIGFEYDTYYPANGNTTIDYIEKNGDETIEVTEEIAVPDVIVDKPENEDKPSSNDKPKNDDDVSETKPEEKEEQKTSSSSTKTNRLSGVKSPKTVDNSMAHIAVAVAIISGSVVIILQYRKKKS